jgi:hypothetical protein
MNLSMKGLMVRAVVSGLCLTVMPVLYGQQSSSTPIPEAAETGWRRFNFGFSVAGYPFNVLNNKDTNINTTTPAVGTYDVTTSNTYQQVGIGPAVEFAITRKFSLAAELYYHRVTYTQIATYTVGANVTTVSVATNSRLWDVPVMLRYRGLRETGTLSKIYFAAGGSLREASHIHSSTTTDYFNGTTAIDYTPVTPTEKLSKGAVVGVGLRLVDDFNIKLEPEIRYTRWFDSTFDTFSTRTRRDQIELDLALKF